MDRVLIVGGGIGGLTLAGALGRRGVEVQMLDNQPEWTVTSAPGRKLLHEVRPEPTDEPTRGKMNDAMATAENVAAGARAVFFSIAYPDPQDGFATEDAASVFEQLGALFHAARAISDPRWLGGAAEHADGAVELPEPKPAQEPRVRRIHMDWRHIEVAVELPWEFIVGGGLVGLVTMTRGVAAAAPTIQVAISSLSAEQADWAQRRTDAERAVIERVTQSVLERSRMRPSYSRIYLGEDDEFAGWIS